MSKGTCLQNTSRLFVLLVILLLLGSCHRSPADKNVASQALRESLHGLTPVQYQGKKIYEHYCLTCHGLQGRGDGFNATTLKPLPTDLATLVTQVDDATLLKVVDGGSVSVGKSSLCPPRKGVVTPEDQKALVSYLHQLTVKP